MNIDQEILNILESLHFPDNGKYVGNGGSSPVTLEYFEYCMEKVHRDGIYDKESLWLEFGVWNGNTLCELASFAPSIVYGFDSFEGLPEDWVKSDIDTMGKGFFDEGGRIPSKLKKHKGIELVVGWFNETLPNFIKTHKNPCSLIHVDCDLYSSTKTVLDTLIGSGQIIPGTIIMFDELIGYTNFQEHEIKALMESGLTYKYIAHTKMQAAIQVIE